MRDTHRITLLHVLTERGEAGDRQIENAKVGLAHVIGLGSACGVHVLEKSAA